MKNHCTNALYLNSIPTLKIYKSTHYKQTTAKFFLEHSTSTVPLIAGDDVFNPKNYMSLTPQDITTIFNEALKLNTNDDEELLTFVRKNGLPVSDCISHIKGYSTSEFFKNYFQEIKPDLLDEVGFSDVYPVEQTRTNLYVFQKLVLLKDKIDQQRKYETYGTNIEKQNNLCDLFGLMITIMFNFNKYYFYPSVRESERVDSPSGIFIHSVISESYTTSKTTSISDVMQKFVAYYNQNNKSVIINSLLNNKQSLQLTKLLETALNIVRKHDHKLADYCYSTSFSWAADDIFIYYTEASKQHMSKEQITLEILSTAEVFFYDLLSDILLDCPNYVSKESDNKMVYSVQLPSLLHGLYYILYTNPNDSLKICINCQSYFLSSSRKSSAKFCSDACGNLFRVRKNRNKKGI